MSPKPSKTDDGVIDRVSARLDDLRDTTASALSADDSPSLRELGRVRRRIDDFEDQLADRVEDLAAAQADLASELRSSNKRTTLPRKLFWMLLGGAAAAIGTWLADPDRGQARRNQLADQARAQAQSVSDKARSQATQAADQVKEQATQVADQVTSQAKDVAAGAKADASHAAASAKGAVAETATDVLPDDVPDDPVVLRQRIKSQVLGHREDVEDVVLTVGDPGHVTLKGTVPSATAEQELVEAVGRVDGVVDVTSELSTTG